MNPDIKFIELCQSGKLEEAQHLYENKRANPYAFNNESFIRACGGGHLPVVTWLSEICNIRKRVYTKALKEAYVGGYIAVVKWLYEKDSSLDIGIYDIETIFKKCCLSGGTEAAKLLFEKYGSSCSGMNRGDTFINCCASGNIDLIKSVYCENISTIAMEAGFIIACGKGHMEVMMLVIELRPNINIHAQQDKAFRECCASGNKQIAEILYEIGGVDIHANNDDAYRRACLNNHLDVVEWLSGKDKMKADRFLFRDVCWAGYYDVARFIYHQNKKDIVMHPREYVSLIYRGHTKIATWVYTLGKINIRRSSYGMFSQDVDDDNLYIFACTTNKIDMVKWMMDICEHYHAIIDDNKVIKWWIDDKMIKSEINKLTRKVSFSALPKTDDKKYVVLFNSKVKVSE